jgi:hypothetical protein
MGRKLKMSEMIMQEEKKYEDTSGRPFWYICAMILLMIVCGLSLSGCAESISGSKRNHATECVRGYLSGDAFFPELGKDGKPVPCRI